MSNYLRILSYLKCSIVRPFKVLLYIIIVMMMSSIYGCRSTKDTIPPVPPKGYKNLTFLKIAHVLGRIDLIEEKPTIPPEINTLSNINYKIVGNDTLRLNIYSKLNIDKPTPLLIFIHGGSWRGGKKEDYLPYIIPFTKRGYVCATISYHLYPPTNFPAAVEDVKCAIRWLRTHAKEYNINPDKIALLGGSAGSHLAMMAGYTDDSTYSADCDWNDVSSKVQAIIAIYGPTDLTTDFAINNHLVVDFLGKKYSEAPQLYKEASPINYVTKDDPPTLIFHGTIDDIVPVIQSDKLKKKLDDMGVENEYHRLKGWPHAMDIAKPVNNYTQYYINEFLKKHIPLK